MAAAAPEYVPAAGHAQNFELLLEARTLCLRFGLPPHQRRAGGLGGGGPACGRASAASSNCLP